MLTMVMMMINNTDDGHIDDNDCNHVMLMMM